MIDSDTLLFGDVQDLDCRNYDGGGGTEKIFVNPCILYWKIGALEDFVLFCLAQYQNPKQWLLLEERYLNLKKEAPYAEINLCDMFLLNLWADTTPYAWKDFFAENNNYLIDGNINHPQCADTHKKTYKMIKELSIKKYTFKDGIPCLSDSADEITPVFAIHCQGSAKQYIDSLFRQNSCL
ncbi:MAG: hypothetical protein NC416_18895 [Eubacterium sp.]|nr:hypothetical protein [Eubacterium sp.]